MKPYSLIVFIIGVVDLCYTNQERKNIQDVQSHIQDFKRSVDTSKTGFKRDYSFWNVGCRNGWKRFRDHCYYLINHRKTWFEAERFCKTARSSLVNVKDRLENNWLQSQFRGVDSFWLGITDGDLNHWINVVDFAPTLYFNWDRNEPGNVGENCGMFGTYSGKWHDFGCSQHNKPFVCKKKLDDRC